MKRLYVGNLHRDATEGSVRALFADCGEVLSCVLPVDRGSGEPRGFAFVDMSHDDAAKAIDALNETDFEGRRLWVAEANRQPGDVRAGGRAATTSRRATRASSSSRLVRRAAFNPPAIAPPVAPYSHAVSTAGSELLFIAGQVPIDRDGNTVGGGDFEKQARTVFDLLTAVLAEDAMTWRHVAKLTVYLTRREDRDAITRIREELFRELFPEGDFPISTLLIISSLYRDGFLIEIEAIAVR